MKWRWPERECFHRRIAVAADDIRMLRDGTVERIPVLCVDCGFRSEAAE